MASVRERLIQATQQRLEDLLEEYDAVSRQHSQVLDAGDKVRISRRLGVLEKTIGQTKAEIEEMCASEGGYSGLDDWARIAYRNWRDSSQKPRILLLAITFSVSGCGCGLLLTSTETQRVVVETQFYLLIAAVVVALLIYARTAPVRLSREDYVYLVEALAGSGLVDTDRHLEHLFSNMNMRLIPWHDNAHRDFSPEPDAEVRARAVVRFLLNKRDLRGKSALLPLVEILLIRVGYDERLALLARRLGSREEIGAPWE